MAILGCLGILGTGELKDNWHENKGAEVLDVSELKIIRSAEQKLGKKMRDIEDLEDGWVGEKIKSGYEVKKQNIVKKPTLLKDLNVSEMNNFIKNDDDDFGFNEFEDFENEKNGENREQFESREDRRKLPPLIVDKTPKKKKKSKKYRTRLIKVKENEGG